MRVLLDERLRQAWNGSEFPYGAVVAALEEVRERFGAERAPSRSSLYEYANRLLDQLERERNSDSGTGLAQEANALLRETVQRAETLLVLIEQANGALTECLERAGTPVQPGRKEWQH
jgi:hypothetical protein